MEEAKGRKKVLIAWNSVVPGKPFLLGFNIYKSMGGKDYEKINPAPIEIDSYEDEAEQIPGVDYFYKVTYVDQDGTESPFDKADPVTLWSIDKGYLFMNYLAKAVNFRVDWLLRSFGEDGALFIKKRAGKRCPKCFDEYGDVPSSFNCDVCFGTGSEGGYIRFNHWVAFSL